MAASISLPYTSTSQDVFSRIRALGGAVFLDSGQPESERGRYDILAAAPLCSLTWCRGRLSGYRLPFKVTSNLCPFNALEQLYQYASTQPQPDHHPEIPFCGGLIGHFSYDLGRVLEQLPNTAQDDTRLPEMQVGLYGWAIVIDHQAQTAVLVGSGLISEDDLATVHHLLTDTEPTPAAAFYLQTPFVSNMDHTAYHQALEQIDDYIHAGDCYQVNFAQRFSARYQGDPWNAYLALRDAAPTPFAAYFDTPDGAVLSLSPERFLAVNQSREVITQPIKGTRPRGSVAEEDRQLAEALHSSTKDRAENVMIVDLLRNDLSRTCELHSVKVPSLFAIESYRNVHHLVSTVTGTLCPDETPIGLLKYCFPGGSITGAPKIRAMEIIDELEPHRRSIYCGSIGYISLCGRMDTSITIRTLLAEQGMLHCWAGGGIVADSQPDQEYQETFDKVNNLLQTLEKMTCPGN